MTPQALGASTATRWHESGMNLFNEESWPSFQAHSYLFLNSLTFQLQVNTLNHLLCFSHLSSSDVM